MVKVTVNGQEIDTEDIILPDNVIELIASIIDK